ncbi:MAG: hypothetical protein ACI9UV_000214 [Algoriphagus sp.]|jgi:hypothetical protein
MEILEESLPETETTVQAEGPFQVQSVNQTLLHSLGRKMGKRTGFNVIESAQQRALSDFTFDLDASLLTTDTLKRRTYTVPFLEKGDKYSTFNLVMVADSVDNVLDQYVLQYEFDSIQYQTYRQTKDFLVAGVNIKRFPFSSFFNDSSPGFLERCDGVYDANGDPVTCDQVTIDSGSGGGGGGSGGTAWTTPGGSTSGDGGSTGSGSGSSGSGSPSSGGGYGGTSCSWTVSYLVVGHNCGGAIDVCDPNDVTTVSIITITCGDPYRRKNSAPEGLMTCMGCSVSDFGSPAFTMTRDAIYIDNTLSDFALTDWHLAYLSNIKNNVFANEFRAFLQAQPNLDQKAAFITLTAQMEGVLNGQMNQNFGRAIDELVAADLSNPAILHLFNSYFSARIAFLKLENPNKYKYADGSLNKMLLYYDAWKEAKHWALDLLGFVPFLGEPADLINGILYAIEGDGVNAALSTASAIPFLGWVTSASKMGMKVIGSASDLNSRKILRWFIDKDQIIKFGDSNQLRGVLGLTDPTKQAHHIIPWANVVQSNPVVQKAAKSGDAFHLNEALNRIPMDTWRNQPNHEIYNNRIKALLDNFNTSYPNASPDDAYNFLNSLIARIRTEIINNPEKHLNEIVFR